MYDILILGTAYGEYNDQVLEVASKYGQTVVTWDFEYEPSSSAVYR